MLEVANHVNKVFHLVILFVLGEYNGLYKCKLMYCDTEYVTLSLQLYRPLNIRVMLVGLEVWNDRDQIDVSTVADHTLNNFLKWRQTYLLPRKKHDNAQFVT